MAQQPQDGEFLQIFRKTFQKFRSTLIDGCRRLSGQFGEGLT
jgi:hypothetical protein